MKRYGTHESADVRTFLGVTVLAVLIAMGGAGCERQTDRTPSAQQSAVPAVSEAGSLEAAAEQSKRQAAAHTDDDKTKVTIGGVEATVWASSVLPDQAGNSYSAAMAFDGDRQTAWVEGAEGSGTGETLTVEFEGEVVLDGFVLIPGYVKNGTIFAKNAVPRDIALRIDGETVDIYTLRYDMKRALRHEHPDCYHSEADVNVETLRVVIFREPKRGRRVTLGVKNAFAGSQYEDLAISEWQPLLVSLEEGLVAPKLVEVLKGLRDVNNFEQFVAADAEVEDLRNKYIRIDARGERIVRYDDPPAYHTLAELSRASAQGQEAVDKFPYFARVSKTERGEGSSVADRFVRYVTSALLNTELVVDPDGRQAKVIGGLALEYGHETGGELYPLLVVDASHGVTQMQEISRHGRRSCFGVIPSID